MFRAKIYLFHMLESDLYMHKFFFLYNFFLSMHKTLNDGNGIKTIILSSKMEKLFIKAYY